MQTFDQAHPGTGSVHPARADRRGTHQTGTDRVLLVLLVILNIGSAYTTVVGARQVLPHTMATVLGLTVQAMLFLALAGFAARHAPIRKWLVVAVLAAASVYTSFFAYYSQLAQRADDAAKLDRAAQAHAAMVAAVYQPALTRLDQLGLEAQQLWDQSRREGAAGLTTGVVGFGPVARRYAEEARNKEVEASRLQADLDRVGSRWDYAVDGLTAEEIYARDLAAWQVTPDAWKGAELTGPERGAYVDLEQEVALLTPYWKVKRGETPAIAAILLALLVDGTAILLGTAIHSRGRPAMESVARHTVDWIHQAKDANAAVQAAWRRPGVVEDGPTPAGMGLEDALRVVVLRIRGTGSDFLGTIYLAIHPETGAIDYASLQGHPNPTYRIAARMLVDRLRSPKLGWVEVQDGFWAIPVEQYPRLTQWLGEQIRVACEEEAELAMDQVEPAERTLRLVLPAA